MSHVKLAFIAIRKDCEQAVYATLLSLRETCPLLENMNISEHGPGWHLTLLLSVFSTITNVELSCAIPGDTLICLSRMANLRALKGTLDPTDPFMSSTTVPLDFASLQHLHWTVCDLSEAAALLHRLQPLGHTREFQSLTFERNNCDIDSDVLKLFLNTLISTCSTQTLSTLALKDGGVPDMMGGEDDCSALGTASADLRPLFQFGCIEVLRLERLPVMLDDAFIAAAATTWPHLRVLHLWSRMPWGCAITPARLLPFARKSRRLEKLEVEIGSWPDPIQPPPYGSADTGRRDVPLSVYIRHSVMENVVERTARLDFIRGIFPNADVACECEELIW
ncbi:hypothetical protein EWM64_g3661 [Hericium alpestre]|uniref:F-box domain-containing protein n=1 Tax=Hericium alpestre TaxID=135208 RepID=A0A4Z0A3T6_9AGAM|nr:hypothetical protein EWM64_g3661 [Hericium alpestre]